MYINKHNSMEIAEILTDGTFNFNEDDYKSDWCIELCILNTSNEFVMVKEQLDNIKDTLQPEYDWSDDEVSKWIENEYKQANDFLDKLICIYDNYKYGKCNNEVEVIKESHDLISIMLNSAIKYDLSHSTIECLSSFENSFWEEMEI